jgi:cobalt-zinc-cadmium efflux system protein
VAHTHASDRPDSGAQRRLAAVLVLTTAYTVAEIVGGLLSGSLALLADAGHMATDDLALGLALFAAWAARRPPDPGRTYGYQRVEILAALANGVLLVVVCGLIVREAIERFLSPRPIDTGLMAAIAAGGLVVNLVGARILHRHAETLNLRAAFLHVLGDLLGSIGTLAAAGCLVLFGWSWVDPAASLLIAGIIVLGSGRLVVQSIHVLLEGAPPHLDAEEIGRSLRDLAGVVDVHDLHLWSVGGREPLLTAHLVIEHAARPHDVLRLARRRMAEKFGIDHVTIQIEPPDYNIRGVGAASVDREPPSP